MPPSKRRSLQSAQLSLSDGVDFRLTEPLPLTRHPAAVYLSGLGEGSVSTMRHSLDAIASLLTNGECDALTLDWSKLRYQHTAAIRAALKQRLAPATANKMLVALRRVLAEAQKLGLIDAKDYAKAVEIPSIKQSGKLRGRALTASEITALMEVCQPEEGAIALRDLALIAILRGSGLRRVEVLTLRPPKRRGILGS